MIAISANELGCFKKTLACASHCLMESHVCVSLFGLPLTDTLIWITVVDNMQHTSLINFSA